MRRKGFLLIAPVLTLLAAVPAAAIPTVYTDRAAWTAAMGGNVVTEDLSGEPAGNHDTPFTLVEGATFTALFGSPITLQVFDGGLVNGTRELHFRDFAAGLNVVLPSAGRGFGFDYDTAVEPWTVQVGSRTDVLPALSTGFVGYVDNASPIASFILRGAIGAQGGLSLDNLSRAGLRFGGLPHAALGQAQLSKSADGSLVASNLGPSGNDGVSIHLGEVEAFTTKAVLKPLATPVGALMQTQTLGTIDGHPNRPAGSAGLRRTTGGYQVLVDYSALGSPTYTARFYNSKGERVGSQSGLSVFSQVMMNTPASFTILKITCTTTTMGSTSTSTWSVDSDIPWQILLRPAFFASTVVFEPDSPSSVPTWLTETHIVGSGMPQLALTGEVTHVHGFGHQATGGVTFSTSGGNLTVSNFGTAGGAGLSTALGRAETAGLTFDTIDPAGKAPVGASITVQAVGSVRGVRGQPLGHLQVMKMADGFMLTPDFSEIGSPTHHLQVFDHGTLVADLPGHSGPAGIAPFWPSRFGKLGGPLECYTTNWPQTINFRVGGSTYAGDEVRTLAEAAPGAIDYKSGFALQATRLDSLTLTAAAADPALCHPSPTRLCLNGGRFGVETAWRTGTGFSGVGQAVPLTGDTGYFWFFANANVEMLVKALNGCGLGNHFWVFAGGLTNVMVTMTVTDAQTGLVQTYVNPQGKAFQPLQDTSAFGTCTAESIAAVTGTALPAPKAAEAAEVNGANDANDAGTAAAAEVEAAVAPVLAAAQAQASSTALLLNNGRFRVETTWKTSGGTQGVGQAVSLTGDTGYFWFFDSANVEMVVKVLNGCGLNQRYWVFAGGLTNVAVTLKVTDTVTGLSKTYVNPQGTALKPIQDTSAFGNCS